MHFFSEMSKKLLKYKHKSAKRFSNATLKYPIPVQLKRSNRYTVSNKCANVFQFAGEKDCTNIVSNVLSYGDL